MNEQGPTPKVLIADKAHDSDPIQGDLRAHGVEPIIPYNRNCLVQAPIDGFVYALRNRIERSVNRLKNSRRIATR